MIRRKRTRVTAAQASPMLTPLIDVALTLLVIFMVATPMLHRAIKVELPKGNVNELQKGKQQETVVYIDAHHKLYVNDTLVKRSELITKLQEQLKRAPQELVLVKADEKVPYGVVMETVDTIKHAGGVSYVGLATQRPRS